MAGFALSTVMRTGGGGTGDATHFPWDDRYDTETAIPIYRRYAACTCACSRP